MFLKTFSICLFLSSAALNLLPEGAQASEAQSQPDSSSIRSIIDGALKGKEATKDNRIELLKAVYTALDSKKEGSSILVVYKDGDKYVTHEGDFKDDSKVTVDSVVKDSKGLLDIFYEKATTEGAKVSYTKEKINKEATVYKIACKDKNDQDAFFIAVTIKKVEGDKEEKPKEAKEEASKEQAPSTETPDKEAEKAPEAAKSEEQTADASTEKKDETQQGTEQKQ